MSKVFALLMSVGFVSVALASEPTQQPQPTVPSVPSTEVDWADPSKKHDQKWDHQGHIAENVKAPGEKSSEGIKWASLNWDKKKDGKIALTAPTLDAPDGEMSK